MTNDEYRAEQAERRQHGLKARHELRLENATYTAAEVKVLTDAALLLGRKEAAEEIAAAIEQLNRHDYRHDEFDVGAGAAAAKAREIASKEVP